MPRAWVVIALVVGCEREPSIEGARAALAEGDLERANAEALAVVDHGGDHESSGRRLLEDIGIEKLRRASTLEGAVDAWTSIRWVRPSARSEGEEILTKRVLELRASGRLASDVRERLPPATRTRVDHEDAMACLEAGDLECAEDLDPTLGAEVYRRRLRRRDLEADAKVPEIDRLVHLGVRSPTLPARQRALEGAVTAAFYLQGGPLSYMEAVPNPRGLDGPAALQACLEAHDHTCVVAAIWMRYLLPPGNDESLELVEILYALVDPYDPLARALRDLFRRVPFDQLDTHAAVAASVRQLRRRLAGWREARRNAPQRIGL